MENYNLYKGYQKITDVGAYTRSFQPVLVKKEHLENWYTKNGFPPDIQCNKTLELKFKKYEDTGVKEPEVDYDGLRNLLSENRLWTRYNYILAKLDSKYQFHHEDPLFGSFPKIKFCYDINYNLLFSIMTKQEKEELDDPSLYTDTFVDEFAKEIKNSSDFIKSKFRDKLGEKFIEEFCDFSDKLSMCKCCYKNK